MSRITICELIEDYSMPDRLNFHVMNFVYTHMPKRFHLFCTEPVDVHLEDKRFQPLICCYLHSIVH